jgi:sarcosine oxidase subunit alpha
VVSEPVSTWLRRASTPQVTLRLDDDALSAAADDTVTLALLDHGRVETTTSAKYRRPRGPYCLAGDCGTCLVRIDGRPNQRACLTPVRDGMRIESQNRLTSRGPDPSRLVDKVIGTMDHHHFMVRPRVVNQAMQAVARELTGFGTLPDRPPETAATHAQHAPDILLVGAGPSGRAAAEVLAAHAFSVLWLDRGLAAPRAGDIVCRARTGVFAAYPAEGLWSAMTDTGGEADVLHTVRPRHVLLCVGARAGILPLPNNDRPGVVAARGLVQQLRRAEATLAVRSVVIGDGEHARTAAERLSAPLVAPARVRDLDGSGRVQRVLTDGDDLDVELVALAPQPAPAHDLPLQAGARLRFDGAGFATERDASGRCESTGPWALWAAGDVTGYLGDEAAADDGRRVAAALAAALHREGPR